MSISDVQRNNALDQLRGIAIIAVVVMHAIALTPHAEDFPIIYKLAHPLGAGMQLFFVLSGLLVASSLDRCLDREQKIYGYFIRRTAKIIPLYYVFTLLNISLFVIIDEREFFQNNIPDSVSWKALSFDNLIVHFLFLHAIYYYLNNIVDGSWSIVSELYSYIVLVIFRNFFYKQYVIYTLMFCIFVSVFFQIVYGYFLRDSSGFTYYGFPSQLLAFVIGVPIFRFAQNDAFRQYYRPFATAGAILSLLLVSGHIRLETAPITISVTRAIYWMPLVLSAIAYPSGASILGSTSLQIFGRQCYAVFFTHLFLLRQSSLFMLEFFSAHSFPVLLAVNLCVGLLGSILLSSLIFDRIDRYCVSLAANYLALRFSKPPQ